MKYIICIILSISYSFLTFADDQFSKIEKKAQAGDKKAQYELGNMYYYGKGIQQDYKKATFWYQKAAGQASNLEKPDNQEPQNAQPAETTDQITSLLETQQAADQGDAHAEYLLGNLYYNRLDYQLALKWLERSANQGNLKAQLLLAKMYLCGLGTPKNGEAATDWYNAAADQGSAEAEYMIGEQYYYDKNYTEALKWQQKSAQKNYPPAENFLGHLYQAGLGVKQDYKKAAKWFQLAVDHGETLALSNLSHMYKIGMGVAKDLDKSLELNMRYRTQLPLFFPLNLNLSWSGSHNNLSSEFCHSGICVSGYLDTGAKGLEENAKKGDANAQYILGYLYSVGQDVPKNASKAFDFFQQALKQGVNQANLELGILYLNGAGVPKDYTIALDYFNKLLDKEDNASAHYFITAIYCIGDDHIKKDYKKAIEELQKVNLKENSDALLYLAIIYSIGGYGVEKDDKKALEYYQQAAKQGSSYAQYTIAEAFTNGEMGLKKNKFRAKRMYESACDNGFKNACDKINKS